jgi:hypothetical protein
MFALRGKAFASWLSVVAVSLAGCGAHRNQGNHPPAATAVATVIAALGSDDPKAAYQLLSDESRREVSFAQFSLLWKQRQQERRAQADDLRQAIKLNPSLNEDASLRLENGRVVHVQRRSELWSMHTPLVATAGGETARDAIQLFARAVAEKDLPAILSTLTKRRRDGIARQVKAFMAGIETHSNDSLSDDGPDRRTLRWDDGPTRFEIILRLEEDQWRIDDIVVRDVPQVGTPEPDTPDTED